MPDPIAAVLAAPDDAAVCAGLFTLLQTHHGNPFDPAAVPPEHRTVLLVWHTQEAIANSGFNGFLGADLPGDPGFALTQAAYEDIGCEPAAAAVRRVFDVFPDRVPPADLRVRVQMFGKANHAVQGALNRDFTKAQRALVAALATYIRDHADAFSDVDQTGLGVPAVVSADTEDADPVAVGSSELPLWARVAFYARCGRQVLALWEEAWPAAPPDYRAVVEQAIVMAERSATEGRPLGDLKTAAGHVARLAAAAMDSEEGRVTPDLPPDHPSRAALIAATAGSALDLITGEDETGSYTFARAVTEEAELDGLLEDIQDDYQRIEEFSREFNWTDKTPVPPDVFDPTFKPTDKKWWKVWGGRQA